jgi:hypothetical protein
MSFESTQCSTSLPHQNFIPEINRNEAIWFKDVVNALIPSIKRVPFGFDEAGLTECMNQYISAVSLLILSSNGLGSTSGTRSSYAMYEVAEPLGFNFDSHIRIFKYRVIDALAKKR